MAKRHREVGLQEEQRQRRLGPRSEFNVHQSGHGLREESCWETKHKVFLSYSGAQRNFTEQLCKDLEAEHYFPFFDTQPNSLPKGEKFPHLIFEAARQCRVAVVVLSNDFFTRSKWPMLELSAFVRAQNTSTSTQLKILPLFFGISVKKFKQAARRNGWRRVWEKWKITDTKNIDVEEWVKATKSVDSQNGLEYIKGDGEVKYRTKVVDAIRKLVRPDLKWDVSHVQAMPQLCEPILQKLYEIQPRHKNNASIVGLYGTGGIGKTTISKALCNELLEAFDGRVCHVEFSPNKSTLELLKQVLRELTHASKELLVHMEDEAQLVGILKERLQRQKVFLVLDNVWENQIDDVCRFLQASYKDGSKVLVTSRSLSVLKTLSISKSGCLEMPKLKEEDAINIFLHYVGLCKPINDNDEKIIKICVRRCQFFTMDLVGGLQCCEYDSGQYFPLALKVFGSHLRSISAVDPSKWMESLKKLDSHKFNPSKERQHPIYHILRHGYDALCAEEKSIFLDLALFVPKFGRWPIEKPLTRVQEWLSTIHRKSQADLEESLQVLRRKALLEEVSGSKPSQIIKIHDLYLDFAKEESQAGPFHTRRISYFNGGSEGIGTTIPIELQNQAAGKVWQSLKRLGISKSKVRSLKKAKLHQCPNVEVLQLNDCEMLEEADVKGMENLRALDVSGCPNLGEEFTGVENLENLVWVRWIDMVKPAPFLNDLSNLTNLQILEVCSYWSCSYLVHPPNLSGCVHLRELTLSGHTELESFPNVSNLQKLEKIDFSWCGYASSPIDLSHLTNLEKINFSGCRRSILSIPYLGNLTKLKEVKFGSFDDSFVLPDLRNLTNLEKIVLREWRGSRFPEFCNLTKLQAIDISNSYTLSGNLRGWSSLTNLQNLSLRHCHEFDDLSGVCELVALWELDCSCTAISELPDLRNLRQLEVLYVKNCSCLGSLVGIDHTTSLRHLDASDCKNLTELPDFSRLKDLEEVDLQNTAVGNLPGDFKRLAKHRILWLQGCWQLIVPLVDLLKELLLSAGQQHELIMKSNGCNSNGSIFSSEAQLHNEQLLECKVMRKCVVDLLQDIFDQSDEFCDQEQRLFLEVDKMENDHHEEDEFISSMFTREISGLETEGTIQFVIGALLKHTDMGPLAYVVGEVAATGRYWPLLTSEPLKIQHLAKIIAQFYHLQIDTLLSNSGERGDSPYLLHSGAMSCILRHIWSFTAHPKMVEALRAQGIDSIVEHFRQDLRIAERCTKDIFGSYEWNPSWGIASELIKGIEQQLAVGH